MTAKEMKEKLNEYFKHLDYFEASAVALILKKHFDELDEGCRHNERYYDGIPEKEIDIVKLKDHYYDYIAKDIFNSIFE
jgi:hypothetical protein